MSLIMEYLTCCSCGDEITGAYVEDKKGFCYCSEACRNHMEESFDDE